mmetsp:Transcript_1826/g.2627  ORF Transcript_1826/g.2627 Transcript_1826/m.2627 type:complete len:702 (+) Transcript_1826:659-2764(+)
MAHYPQRPDEPDCRDFLRTGRCKYGDSCKYHHPVGGVKAPSDPSEPPFPVRPNEPPCQYYLKHGTCKFGQMCKFHHPAHIITTGSNPLNGTVLMNVNNNTVNTSFNDHRVVLNGVETYLNSSEFHNQGSLVQILPQRPGEPDCIFYLRNGRCKYGATCKYHHPASSYVYEKGASERLSLQAQYQTKNGRGRAISTGSMMESGLRFLPPHRNGDSYYGRSQAVIHHNNDDEPTHILVSDAPISVMTLNQNKRISGASHRQGTINNTNVDNNLCREINEFNHLREEHSSQMGSPTITSTTMASSYDTAFSNFDNLPSSALGYNSNHSSQHQLESNATSWRRHVSVGQLPLMDGSDFKNEPDKYNARTSLRENSSVSGQFPSLDQKDSQTSNRSDYFHHSSFGPETESDKAKLNINPRNFEHKFTYQSSGDESSIFEMNNSGTSFNQYHEDRHWSTRNLNKSQCIQERPAAGELTSAQDSHNRIGFDSTRLSSSASNNMSTFSKSEGNESIFSPVLVEKRPLDKKLVPRVSNTGQSRQIDDGLSMVTSALLTMLDTPDDANDFHYAAANDINSSPINCDSKQVPTPIPARENRFGNDIILNSSHANNLMNMQTSTKQFRRNSETSLSQFLLSKGKEYGTNHNSIHYKFPNEQQSDKQKTPPNTKPWVSPGNGPTASINHHGKSVKGSSTLQSLSSSSIPHLYLS